MRRSTNVHFAAPLVIKAMARDHIRASGDPFCALEIEFSERGNERDTRETITLFVEAEDSRLAHALADAINAAAKEHGNPARSIGDLANKIIAEAAEVAPARQAAE